MWKSLSLCPNSDASTDRYGLSYSSVDSGAGLLKFGSDIKDAFVSDQALGYGLLKLVVIRAIH